MLDTQVGPRLWALSLLVALTIAGSASAKEFPGRHSNPALYRGLPERLRGAGANPPRDTSALAYFRGDFPKAEIRWDPYTGGAMLLWDFETKPSADSPERVARDFLRKWSAILKLPETFDLEYRGTQDFFTFSLVRFEQVYGKEKIPVRWNEIYVYLTTKKAVWQVFTSVLPALAVKTQAKFAEADCSSKAKTELGIKKLRAAERSRRVVQPQQSGDLMAYELVMPAEDPFGTWEIVVDAADCRILSSRDLVRYTDGRGRVFDPNPIVAARNGKLRPSSQILDAWYRTVKLPGIDASDVLTGTWADTSPTMPRSRSSSLSFLYSRGAAGFAETMAYYHVTRALEYLVSLRPQPLPKAGRAFEPVKIDALGHCMREDTSCYDPSAKTIILGRGGAMPDAEDAHVILHELGHAVLDQRSPGFDKTPEAQAIAEGFSDYLALTMFREQNFEPACFAPWAASQQKTGSPPCLRRLSPGKTFDQRVPDGQPEAPWLNSEIWSATLWDIRNKLPQKDADLIILEAHSGLPPLTTTMSYVGRNLLMADQNIFGGKNWKTIKSILGDRKIDPDKP